MKKSILIVEDEAIIASSLTLCFKALGYNVLKVASRGEDAIARFEQSNPDIILMDISLRGGMDGYETMRVIRRNSHAPVIYLTGGDLYKLDEKARGTHPYDYMIKPFEFDILESKIKILLEEREEALKAV